MPENTCVKDFRAQVDHTMLIIASVSLTLWVNIADWCVQAFPKGPVCGTRLVFNDALIIAVTKQTKSPYRKKLRTQTYPS